MGKKKKQSGLKGSMGIRWIIGVASIKGPFALAFCDEGGRRLRNLNFQRILLLEKKVPFEVATPFWVSLRLPSRPANARRPWYTCDNHVKHTPNTAPCRPVASQSAANSSDAIPTPDRDIRPQTPSRLQANWQEQRKQQQVLPNSSVNTTAIPRPV